MAEPIVITPPTPLPAAPPVPQRNDPATFEERNDAGYEFVFEQLPPALGALGQNVFRNAKAAEERALSADASASAAAESERKSADSEGVAVQAKDDTVLARDTALDALDDVEAIATKFGDVDGAVTVATEQAGIATTKASEATNRAAAAGTAANRAEQAKDAAGVLTSFYKSFLTEADMREDRATAAGRTAIVIEGPGAGWYYKVGASGAGSWERLPNQPAFQQDVDEAVKGSASAGDVIRLESVTGSANAVVGTVSSAQTDIPWGTGTTIQVRWLATNTGPATLNGYDIRRRDGSVFAAGELVGGARYVFVITSASAMRLTGVVAISDIPALPLLHLRQRNSIGKSGPIALVTSGSGTNNISASLPASFAELGIGLEEDTQVMFRAPAANTGNVTLMGVPLLDADGLELLAGTLRLGRRYYARHTLAGGAHFRLIGSAQTPADVAARDAEIARLAAEAKARGNQVLALGDALASVAMNAGTYSPLIPMLGRIGAWYDFTDKYSLWQDEGKSTPVRSDGDPIGFVEDKSGNGFHFLADAPINRPVWRQGIGGAAGVATFSPGTSSVDAQYLRAARRDLTNGKGDVSVFVLARFRGFAGTRSIITHSAGANSAITRMAINVVGGRPMAQVRMDDATSVQAQSYIASGWNYAPDEFVILEATVKPSEGKLAFYSNGRNTADGIVNLPAVTSFPSSDEAAAYLSSPINRLDGDVLAVVELVGDVSERDRVGMYQYFSKLAKGLEFGDLEKYNPQGELPVTFFWFNAPNVIRVASEQYLVGGVDSSGSVLSGHYDFNTGSTRHAFLHRTLEIDDHNVPSFAQLPDGNVVAVYSKHNGDGATWLTKTVTPGDYTAWTAPVDIGPQIHTTPGHDYLVSYNFLFRHSGEGGRLYYIHREGDRTAAGGASILTQEYWVISWSDDNGVSWTRGRKLWGPQRPYTRVWSNGVDRLDFFFNDSHPNADTTNRIHHCYLKGGSFYKSEGTLIGGMDVLPLDFESDPTLVFDANLSTVGNAWVWDLTYDANTGRPVGTFVTYRNNYADLDYYQARWSGAAWTLHHISPAGASLSPDHNVYAGGVVQDPSDIDQVYCSIMVDASGQVTTDRAVGVFQIFRCITADGGATWARTQLTHERQHAFRPVFAPGGSRLCYVSGDYGPHYTKYFTRVRWLDI